MAAKEFYKAAKAALDPIAKPLGFCHRGRFYYRIVGDVVQSFCPMWRNYIFTMRFNITSVYSDNSSFYEAHEISCVIDGSNDWLGFWMETTPSGKLVYAGPCTETLLNPDMARYADVCADAVKQHLIPFFDMAVDSESAHRLLHEKAWPRQDHHFGCFEFLLGAGEWEDAKNVLAELLKRPHGTQAYWNEYWKLFDALEALDVSYILSYMETKEAATYAALHWKRNS